MGMLWHLEGARDSNASRSSLLAFRIPETGPLTEDTIVTRQHSRMDRARLGRERITVDAMIGIYCRGPHGTGRGLCRDCAALQVYASQRLQECPFQEGKTTCARCAVHCYVPEMRERIRAVMRYAGPRMLYRHPIMTVQHMIDGRRSEPIRMQRESADRAEGAAPSKAGLSR